MYIVSHNIQQLLRFLYEKDLDFTMKYNCPQAIIAVGGFDFDLVIQNIPPEGDEEDLFIITVNNVVIYKGQSCYKAEMELQSILKLNS